MDCNEIKEAVLKHVLLVRVCDRESVYVCLYFPVCVFVSERERERDVFVCVSRWQGCVFVKLSRVLCKIDFSISFNVAIL